MKEQLKAYSLLTGDDMSLGLPSTNHDDLLELGDAIATSRPGLIVHLQKWVPEDE